MFNLHPLPRRIKSVFEDDVNTKGHAVERLQERRATDGELSHSRTIGECQGSRRQATLPDLASVGYA